MKFAAIAVLIFSAAVAFGQQTINFPACDKVAPGAVIAPPDGTTYSCKDGQWKHSVAHLPAFVTLRNGALAFVGLFLLCVVYLAGRRSRKHAWHPMSSESRAVAKPSQGFTAQQGIGSDPRTEL